MRTFFALAAAAASLVSAQSAIDCPSGDNAGRAQNTQMYLASVDDVKGVIGNFQNSDWQGLKQVNSTGAENAVGATRSVSYGPLTLVEELVSISSNATYGQQVFKLANAPLTVAQGINLTGYQENLEIMPLCESGNSSQISWTVDFCFAGPSNATQTVAGLFTQAHTGALNNVTTLLGRGNFTACPSGANSTDTATSAAAGMPMMTGTASAQSATSSSKPNGASTVAAGASAALLAVGGLVLLL